MCLGLMGCSGFGGKLQVEILSKTNGQARQAALSWKEAWDAAPWISEFPQEESQSAYYSHLVIDRNHTDIRPRPTGGQSSSFQFICSELNPGKSKVQGLKVQGSWATLAYSTLGGKREAPECLCDSQPGQERSGCPEGHRSLPLCVNSLLCTV